MVRPSIGRPMSVEPAVVAVIAAELFAHRGYDTTTVDDVASAAGISRRSLFNYFPQKAALVWWGFGPFIEALEARLATVRADKRLGDELARCNYEALLTFGSLDEVRTRLRIIAANDDVRAYGAVGQTEVRACYERFFTTYGISPGLSVKVLSMVVTEVGMAASLHWAVHSTEPTPRHEIEQAYLALSAFSSKRARADDTGSPHQT
jgi:AcrR family transcriptional regulator